MGGGDVAEIERRILPQPDHVEVCQIDVGPVAELDVAPRLGPQLDRTADGAHLALVEIKAVDGVLEGEGDVDEVVAKRGLEVVRDDGAIEKAVDEALAANPDIVEKYKAGNKKVTGAIVGAVMKATQGKADPGQVNQLIAKKLS